MELGLQNRAALVAASTKGLGFALAQELVREGCRVMICGRDAARLEAAVVRLRAQLPANGEAAAVAGLNQECSLQIGLCDAVRVIGHDAPLFPFRPLRTRCLRRFRRPHSPRQTDRESVHHLRLRVRPDAAAAGRRPAM